MELERLNVVLVPRRAWAAMDMGFALGAVWFMRLWLAWAVVAVPALLLAIALMPWGSWLAMLVLWWLKPAYEQLPLYVLSRAVFDDSPTLREVVRQVPRWVPRGLFANVTWRRLAASRSFTAPVMQLEGLRGKARGARLETLYEAGNAGTWLTIAGAHFESLLYLSGLAIGYMLLPEELSLRDDLLGQEGFVQASQLLLDFAAISVIAPFYVAAGFSLYLHRRAQLEGWDIELVFRRLRKRAAEKQGLPVSLVSLLVAGMLTVGLLGMPPPLLAADAPLDHESAARIIGEVLQHPDFGTKRTATGWRWKSEPDESEEDETPSTWPTVIAQIGEYLMWFAGAALIAYALIRLPDWLDRLPRRRRAQASTVAPPTTLFGLDVRRESLPENIPEAARELIGRGEYRDALALLYRGALYVLIVRDGVALRHGHTEGECVAQVRASCTQPLCEFFGDLTRGWQHTAYGHVVPLEEKLRAQCNAWTEHFGGEQ